MPGRAALHRKGRERALAFAEILHVGGVHQRTAGGDRVLEHQWLERGAGQVDRACSRRGRTPQRSRYALTFIHDAARRVRTSLTLGLVAADPSAKTTVGTVWLPPFTLMT